MSILISRKMGSKTYTIKIVDSYNILTTSLAKLCITFNCVVQKGYFPYNFVTNNTLFYIGDKPNLSFYNDPDLTSYRFSKQDVEKLSIIISNTFGIQNEDIFDGNGI